MTHGRFLMIALGLITIVLAATGLTSINHPIILKWVIGPAKHHGKPIPATVYVNGQQNDQVKVFYSDEENNYLLSLNEHDTSGTVQFLNLNLNEKWIGMPSAISKSDYDFIAGHLFQSEAGAQFSPVQYESSTTFDPQFSVTGRTVRFNLPSYKSKLDSVRINLP